MAYTRDDLVYFAGIMDGEGWFSIQRIRTPVHKNAKSANYTSTIGVANTDKRLMEWLVSKFGGSYTARKPLEGQFGSKIRYEWHPSKIVFIEEIIPKIFPFLVLKKERAELLLELRKLISLSYRKTGVPPKISEKREEIYQELRKLNNTKHKVILV